jgi:hypothetical protein
MPKYTNHFGVPDHYEHEFRNNRWGKIGKLRLKPNRVLWKPKGRGVKFYSVSLGQFTSWIMDPGTNASRTKS